ncbi:PREDICTED: protein indeterminate-domain 16-like [Nelumbo nucifera]|uniref:Protein indeterminate-domain 16-like n=2 Tax=Nelumbo nucifera TaxID=4432 RepID=A0A1U7ZPW8_NELNU|nr:PREDICTED: protein indeterminate-domain 16-like [Nelumbo nucifera]DAD34244.1 TPA_asm: hypothetical protein HUJ06_004884 [Nelumbo nucifera]
MEQNDHKELQLLPASLHPSSSPTHRSSCMSGSSNRKSRLTLSDPFDGPSLDLQLSISLRPFRPQSDCLLAGSLREGDAKTDLSCVQALKWQAAEQIRLATIEKAYAEQVRELTRREMELAQSEFMRAKHLWERAREEVEKAKRMKEMATHQVDSTCMEITCQACRQRFRP